MVELQQHPMILFMLQMSKLDISFNFPRDYALLSTKQQQQIHVDVVCEGQRKTATFYLRMEL